MRQLLIFIHLSGVIVWIGGMAFAHFCLRPVAAELLPPPQRLPLLSGVLGRFFRLVAVALAALWATGFVRFAQAGAAAPANWTVMAAIGLLMTVIYLVIVMRFYPALRAAVAAERWPDGAAAMNRIRQLVFANLLLGFLTLAVAILGA